MAAQMIQRTRQASPARWQRAAQRATVERIQVRQLNDSGAWVASSGSDPKVAYTMEIVAGVVRSCSCPAGDFGDPCCKHAGRFYVDAGLLDVDEDGPDDPAPALRPLTVPCLCCTGGKIEEWGVSGPIGFTLCDVCGGSGLVPAPQPAERIAA